MIRVLVADDSEVIRHGLRLLTDCEPDMRVVAGAEDGARAVALALEVVPDVVVMDLCMPGLDGVSATRLIVDALPAVRVLALTFRDDGASIAAARAAGAAGYLVKDVPALTLVKAIRALGWGYSAPSSRIHA